MSSSRSRLQATWAFLIVSVIFGIALGGALDLGSSAHAAPAPKPSAAAPANLASGSYLPSFADLAERVLPAVVSIDAQRIQRRPEASRRPRGDGNPFEFFLGPQPEPDRDGEYRTDSGGSGFVVSADGFVITNNHVIEGATKVRVRLGERYLDAEIKGTDAATDLALLKIDAGESLAALPLGDSERLRVGDYVMAIGNPLTLNQTVTVGVVSAKGRAIGLTPDRSFENFIQTDAAINRGNSGGPLVNLNGEVVGIATAMNWGAENIGFAVPVDTLKAVLPQLREKGKVSRGYLGINIQNLDYDRARAFGLDVAEGALVTSVFKDSPAKKAGVEHGDVILRVDDVRIRETRDLIDYVSGRPPGAKVRLELIRNGKEIKTSVELDERTIGTVADSEEREGESRGIDWLGLDFQDLGPQLRENLGIPSSERGVLVREVTASSPLYDEGVAVGDLIVEINGQPVDSSSDFERQVTAAPAGSYLRLYVKRFDRRRSGEGASFFAIVRVP